MAVNDIVMGAAGASGPATFVEDVFSTWLYTGTGASQTITNGIDLSTKGGLVWMKGRSGATANALYDTNRGATFDLVSETNNAQSTQATGLTSFNSSGFAIGALAKINTSAATYASWSFRKQPKFFDVVTYTGTSTNRTIAHNLGSVPGCIIIKASNDPTAWQVYHRSLANTQYMVLNTTAIAATGATRWNSTTPTDTVFSLGTDSSVNAVGGNYVAYIFAHDAGGFGATGTDNVISCGTFTTDASSNATINLGYEPQWVMIRDTASIDNWIIQDNMRGMINAPSGMVNSKQLFPNLASAETNMVFQQICPTATGFFTSGILNASKKYIYIAIRRPMKTPAVGTSVFSPVARTGTGTNATVTGSSIADAVLIKNNGAAVASLFSSRLTGTGYLVTSTTAAEVSAGTTILQANPWDVMNGVKVGTTSTITNASANTFVNYLFTRAAGFFDVVCFTPTGVAHTEPHNLGVSPELIIGKSRSDPFDWYVYAAPLGNTKALYFNTTDTPITGTYLWNNTSPTSTTFSLGASGLNTSASTAAVAYLFATVAGVSKVGTYTGNGSSQTINCSFTTGARFIMIKRTDNTGDWFYWDTARGIVAGNDPHLSFNTAVAEVTTDDSVDADSSGFIVNQLAATNINVTSATYIFLAIA